MGLAVELLKLFPNEPPSKEFIEKLIEFNRLSGNKILGPIEYKEDNKLTKETI